MQKRLHKTKPELIGDVLKNVVEQLSQAKKQDIFTILTAWPKLAGKDLARHSQPASLKKGTLRVYVDESAWLYQAKFLQEQLLQAVKNKIGNSKVETIKFRIGNIKR